MIRFYARCKNEIPTVGTTSPRGEGALGKATYGEACPIFLGLNFSKSDIFGFKLTEVIARIFSRTQSIVKQILQGPV